MTARFHAQEGRALTPHSVVDRKTSDTVAYCNDARWAEMIADGLNMIVDQVTPWSPSSAYVDVLDGEVVDDHGEEQKAIGWHDEPLSSL